MTAHLFTTWFAEHFKLAVDIYCSKKEIPVKIFLPVDEAPAHPRALMEMYSEINVVFMPANIMESFQLSSLFI